MDLIVGSSPQAITNNSNFTSDSMPYELFEGYSSGLLGFAAVACIVFMLVGIPGNLITIIALARCKKVRNATAVFIINLSLSDLLFCCFNLPLAASTFLNRAWTHGELLCRLFPMLRYGLLAVSLFTVLAITINRYVMIGHPRTYPRIYRHHYLGFMVMATWLCAFSALIPTWRQAWGKFGLDKNIGSCSILPDENSRSPKEFLFIMAFGLPCLSIIICYARIFYIVRKTAMRTHDPILSSVGSVRIPNKKQQKKDKEMEKEQKQKKKILDENNKNEVKNSIERTTTSEEKQFSDEKIEINDNQRIENNSNEIRNSFENLNNITNLDQISELSFSISRNNSLYRPRKYLTKYDELKFIDTSIDSDLPPQQPQLSSSIICLQVTTINHDMKPFNDNKCNLSSTSINKSVEFSNENDYENNEKRDIINYNHGNIKIKSNMKKLKNNYKDENNHGHNDVDSAFEVSTTSSSDNNQMNSNQKQNFGSLLHPVHIDPSSSSGIDLEPPNSPKRTKKTFAGSLRRSTRFKKKNKDENIIRKLSTAASGASILYPGRMTTKDRRLLKMILVIFISFLICYLPITLTKIVHSVTSINFINIMGYVLIYLTTCINPIIYVVMSSEYRQAYKNLLMCRTANSHRNNNIVLKKGSQQRT